jgi:hypothetical protein
LAENRAAGVAANIETTFTEVARRNSAELDFRLVRRTGAANGPSVFPRPHLGGTNRRGELRDLAAGQTGQVEAVAPVGYVTTL